MKGSKRKIQIERRSKISVEEFMRDFGTTGVPVVLEDYILNWDCIHDCSWDSLKNKYGSLEVLAKQVGNATNQRSTTLRDYIEYVDNLTGTEKPYYLSDWLFQKQVPELRTFDTPAYFKNWLEIDMKYLADFSWIFVGPAHSYSTLHVDTMMTAGWNGLIDGEKVWHFYSPDQGNNLYAGSVNTFDPDYSKFPRACDVTTFECIQRPGDIVFTPSGWWHQVYNRKNSIAVAENYVNDTNYKLIEDFLLASGMHEEFQLLKLIKDQYHSSKIGSSAVQG